MLLSQHASDDVDGIEAARPYEMGGPEALSAMFGSMVGAAVQGDPGLKIES